MSATAVPRPAAPAIASGRWAKWLVPDFALVVAVATLFTCLILQDGTRALFRDSDAGWHIRTGEAILNGSGLPRTDPYSFINNGQPWFAWEWLADIAMGATHQWGGPAAVAVLFALLLAVSSWMWMKLTWAVRGDFLLACIFSFSTLMASRVHWLARPHVFSWIFLLLAIWYIEKERAPVSPLRFAAIFAFGVLWANTHASFFFGPIMAAVYAAGLLIAPLLWNVEIDKARIRMLLTSGLAAGAGSFVNPYGWELHRHVVAYLGNAELLRRISEFRSFDFHSEGSSFVLLCLAAGAIGALLAFAQRTVGRALLLSMLVVLAIRTSRGLPLLALIGMPLANAAMRTALENARGLRASARRCLDAYLAYSRNLQRLDVNFGGLALAAALAVIAFAWSQLPEVEAHAGFPQTDFPVEAANTVETLPATARILAPDQFGGYFIYRFHGRRKIYFDGRTDFYGAGQMRAYLDLVELHPKWRARLDEFGFTHAVLPKGDALGIALRLIGWREMHRDALADILVRP